MPDGSTAPAHLNPETPRASRPTHLRGNPFPTRHQVTPEMQEAGAAALAALYAGVAIDCGNSQLKVLTSDTAMGCAAARAYFAMEQVNEQGERDHLQHPGLFGGDDLLTWSAMTPLHRAGFIQEQSGDYVLGAVGMIRGLRTGIENPGQRAALGMLCDSLTAVARELQRAAALMRRASNDRTEQAMLREKEQEAQAAERRERDNRARRDRRRRAKPEAEGPAEQVTA